MRVGRSLVALSVLAVLAPSHAETLAESELRDFGFVLQSIDPSLQPLPSISFAPRTIHTVASASTAGLPDGSGVLMDGGSPFATVFAQASAGNGTYSEATVEPSDSGRLLVRASGSAAHGVYYAFAEAAAATSRSSAMYERFTLTPYSSVTFSAVARVSVVATVGTDLSTGALEDAVASVHIWAFHLDSFGFPDYDTGAFSSLEARVCSPDSCLPRTHAETSLLQASIYNNSGSPLSAYLYVGAVASGNGIGLATPVPEVGSLTTIVSGLLLLLAHLRCRVRADA